MCSAVFGPVLILTGIAGFLIPPRLALMSGAPAYNVFHIVFGADRHGAGAGAERARRRRVQPRLRRRRPLPGGRGRRRACSRRAQFRYRPADHVLHVVLGLGLAAVGVDGAAMSIVDLRSDTFTQPTPAMRAAMAGAEVGDDVWGDDPTARRLEERAAELLGKEAALFVPSGTMANQIALLLHCRPGDEVIVGRGAHTRLYESGAGAAWAGVQFAEVGGADGTFTADDVDAAALPDDRNLPRTRAGRGREHAQPRRRPRLAARAARRRRARAPAPAASRCTSTARASGTPRSPAASPERELAAPFDTVSACFSKGLGAPVGSVIAAARDDVERARRFRKMLGGGMRQVGILARGGAVRARAPPRPARRRSRQRAPPRRRAGGRRGRAASTPPRSTPTSSSSRWRA